VTPHSSDRPESPAPRPFWASFRAGFLALMPLWLGIAPFAVAYAVTARAAHLSVFETLFMSLTVFAGASQFAAAGLFGQGTGAFPIVATTFLLNVRHVLYGLSLARQLPLSGSKGSGWKRLLTAQFLTDEAYGVAVSAGPRQSGGLDLGFLIGAEISLYVIWNLFTLLGALAGSVIPDPKAVGADVVFPLAFLGLLVPLLAGRRELIVALFAGALAWGTSRLLPGLTVLVAGVGGALLGAYLSTRQAVDHESGRA
jgi:4-azaleucine resistance transporter AzlC